MSDQKPAEKKSAFVASSAPKSGPLEDVNDAAPDDAPSDERLLEAEPSAPARYDEEPSGPRQIVAVSGESVTLPSGASFSLAPGQVYTVSPDDAKALIASGYAVEG